MYSVVISIGSCEEKRFVLSDARPILSGESCYPTRNLARFNGFFGVGTDLASVSGATGWCLATPTLSAESRDEAGELARTVSQDLGRGAVGRGLTGPTRPGRADYSRRSLDSRNLRKLGEDPS